MTSQKAYYRKAKTLATVAKVAEVALASFRKSQKLQLAVSTTKSWPSVTINDKDGELSSDEDTSVLDLSQIGTFIESCTQNEVEKSKAATSFTMVKTLDARFDSRVVKFEKKGKCANEVLDLTKDNNNHVAVPEAEESRDQGAKEGEGVHGAKYGTSSFCHKTFKSSKGYSFQNCLKHKLITRSQDFREREDMWRRPKRMKTKEESTSEKKITLLKQENDCLRGLLREKQFEINTFRLFLQKKMYPCLCERINKHL